MCRRDLPACAQNRIKVKSRASIDEESLDIYMRVYSLPRSLFYFMIEDESFNSTISKDSLRADVVSHLVQTYNAAEVLRRWTHLRVARNAAGA